MALLPLISCIVHVLTCNIVSSTFTGAGRLAALLVFVLTVKVVRRP